MSRPPSRSLADRLLNWAYDRTLQAAPGLASAEDLAREFRAAPGALPQQIDRLIRWQCAKAGAVGFLSGLGGLLTLPITVPGDVAAVTYLHVRMTVAIAIMAGHDPRSERVRTFAFLALVGNSLTALLKEVGIEMGRRLATSLVERASGEALARLQGQLGSRLVAKTTQKSAMKLGRLVPLAGGLVGGSIDALATRAVGRAAKRIFLSEAPLLLPGAEEVLEGQVLVGPERERPSLPRAEG